MLTKKYMTQNTPNNFDDDKRDTYQDFYELGLRMCREDLMEKTDNNDEDKD
jgi:hypothetical protein